MYIDLKLLQDLSWSEKLSVLFDAADRIVKEYQSPFKNDAKGSLDCYRIEERLGECRNILKRHKKEEK